MSVKTVSIATPPFCEYDCLYLCDLCAFTMKEATGALNAEDDEECGALFSMYPTRATQVKPIIPVFTEVVPKIIKIKQVIFVDQMEPPPPLKMEIGEIVSYPTE